jgi:hypothetical protein
MGGSGMRTAESLSYLVASGYFLTNDDELHILLVDAHKLNRNLANARVSFDDYKKLRKAFNSQSVGQMFKPVVSVYEWDIMFDADYVADADPINITLRDMCAMDVNGEALPRTEKSRTDAEKLMTALYSEYEMGHSVSQGYHAHPAIGAAFGTAAAEFTLAQSGKSNDFREFYSNYQKSLRDKDTKLILCGSLFGGTGASCLSALVRVFVDKNKTAAPSDHNAIVGGIFLLPYFAFRQEQNGEIDQNMFRFSTEKAIKYYNDRKLLKTRNNDSGFYDALYLIGFDSPVERAPYHDDDFQLNPPHFVELEAALAICDFFRRPVDDENGVVYMKGVKKVREKGEDAEHYMLSWENFSNGKTLSRKLIDFMQAALVFNLYIYPNCFDGANDRSTDFVPYRQYIMDADYHREHCDRLRTFFERFLKWNMDIATSLLETSVENSKSPVADRRTQSLYDLSVLWEAFNASKFDVDDCGDVLKKCEKILLSDNFNKKIRKVKSIMLKPARNAGETLTLTSFADALTAAIIEK